MDHFFYSNKIFDGRIHLEDDEAYHALKVLRKKQGDNIFVVNGLGSLFSTVIEEGDVSNCMLKVMEEKENYQKPNHHIHIAIAPTKSHDRMEWFVEKAVEIGIQEISFLQTKRTERKNIKIDRIKKRAISSMKQSLKAFLPFINEFIDYEDFLKTCNNNHKYVGYLGHGDVEKLSKVCKTNDDYCVMIGPEGDFTEQEIIDALDSGFNCISLSESRLRTETAGLMACNILNIINQ